MAACFALGVIGDNRTVEHLIKNLEIGMGVCEKQVVPHWRS